MGKYLFKAVLISLLLNVFIKSLTAQVNMIYNAVTMGKDMRGLSGVQIINSSIENYTGALDIEVKSLDRGILIVKVLVPSVIIKPGNNIIQVGYNPKVKQDPRNGFVLYFFSMTDK